MYKRFIIDVFIWFTKMYRLPLKYLIKYFQLENCHHCSTHLSCLMNQSTIHHLVLYQDSIFLLKFFWHSEIQLRNIQIIVEIN